MTSLYTVRRLPFLLAGLTLLLALPAQAREPVVVVSAPGTTTLAEYRTLVTRGHLAASQKTLPAPLAKSLSAQFRAVRTVTLPNGRQVPVDLKSEADDFARLAQTPGGGVPPSALAARLDALEDQIAEGRPTAPENSPDPRAQASEILRGKEFEQEPEQFKPRYNWIEKALDWILRMLGKFLRWLFGRAPNWNPDAGALAGLGDLVLYTLYFLAAVAATVALYFLGRWGLRRYLKHKGLLRDEVGATGLDLTDEGITDPLGTAREMAARGEYRGAIRLAYIASLHRLSAGGLLVLEQNRTNWEYQRALRGTSRQAYDTLLPATRLFDRVWYGHQGGTQAEFEGLLRIHEQLPASPPLSHSVGEGGQGGEGNSSTPGKGGNTW